MTRRWALALGCAGLLTVARAAEDVAVALPPFLVEEPVKGPPWRYGRAAGFEILSRCDESVTRRVVETHDRLHQLLAEILPPSLQLTWSVPRTLILYDEELQPKASQEVIERLLRGRPEIPDIDVGSRSGGVRSVIPGRRISFLPNLRLWDRDGMAVFMIVRRDGFDADRLALTDDYVSFLLKHRAPPLPLWFISGLIDLYRQVTFEGGELRAAPLVWPRSEAVDTPNREKISGIAPLDAFFTYALPATEGIPTAEQWRAQAALLVRWGLEPRNQERRAAFFRLVERAATSGVSEQLFEECLGLNFVAARMQLAAYFPTATRVTTVYRPAKFTKLPAYPLAPATDAQLARIKGDWERLQVPYVKAISPDLEAKYLELARKTLRRGHERASTDPGLLAVMGLCEVDAGNDAAAAELLEAAAEAGEAQLRPRASYELARLRLAAGRAASGGAELGVNQLVEVLRPLFAAREKQPAMAETYELIAAAWSATSAVPTRRHLGVLDEGVRLFPRRATLALAAAELHVRHGFREEARLFLEVAERVRNADATTVARITAVRESLARER